MRKNKTPLLLRIIQWLFPKIERTFPTLAHRLFIKIFFTPLNYRLPSKEAAFEQSADKFSLKVHNKRIQCYSWGHGPLILVIHGWAGRATQFRKIIAALVKENYRVVGFDGPAHGKSDGISTSIVGFEAVLRTIYELIGVPEGIIAHSFGGAAALLAAMNGLPVKKLINIASPTIGDDIINTYLRTINGSAATGRSFKAHILKTTGKPFEEFTAVHFIARIKQDIDLLLVHDEDDPEVSIGQAVEIARLYPKAILFKTCGLGHTRILKDEQVIKRCVAYMKG